MTARQKAIEFGRLIPSICSIFGCSESTGFAIACIWFKAVESGEFGE